MSDKLSNNDAVDIIETEGLESAILHYVRADRFSDFLTANRWRDAENALLELAEYLEEQTGRSLEL